MKKWIAVLLCVATIFSLASCGATNTASADKTGDTTTDAAADNTDETGNGAEETPV